MYPTRGCEKRGLGQEGGIGYGQNKVWKNKVLTR